jgi:asparagine synthase (glutamine-hydrolysing)
MTYMRNQLLRDSDWASMDHSVELRTPLVDAFLLEQITPLLPDFVRFPGKRLLAEAPTRSLPDAIFTRQKTGFGIPVTQWLPEWVSSTGDTGRRAVPVAASRCYTQISV